MTQLVIGIFLLKIMIFAITQCWYFHASIQLIRGDYGSLTCDFQRLYLWILLNSYRSISITICQRLAHLYVASLLIFKSRKTCIDRVASAGILNANFIYRHCETHSGINFLINRLVLRAVKTLGSHLCWSSCRAFTHQNKISSARSSPSLALMEEWRNHARYCFINHFELIGYSIIWWRLKHVTSAAAKEDKTPLRVRRRILTPEATFGEWCHLQTNILTILVATTQHASSVFILIYVNVVNWILFRGVLQWALCGAYQNNTERRLLALRCP